MDVGVGVHTDVRTVEQTFAQMFVNGVVLAWMCAVASNRVGWCLQERVRMDLLYSFPPKAIGGSNLEVPLVPEIPSLTFPWHSNAASHTIFSDGKIGPFPKVSGVAFLDKGCVTSPYLVAKFACQQACRMSLSMVDEVMDPHTQGCCDTILAVSAGVEPKMIVVVSARV